MAVARKTVNSVMTALLSPASGDTARITILIPHGGESRRNVAPMRKAGKGANLAKVATAANAERVTLASNAANSKAAKSTRSKNTAMHTTESSRRKSSAKLSRKEKRAAKADLKSENKRAAKASKADKLQALLTQAREQGKQSEHKRNRAQAAIIDSDGDETVSVFDRITSKGAPKCV